MNLPCLVIYVCFLLGCLFSVPSLSVVLPTPFVIPLQILFCWPLTTITSECCMGAVPQLLFCHAPR